MPCCRTMLNSKFCEGSPPVLQINDIRSTRTSTVLDVHSVFRKSFPGIFIILSPLPRLHWAAICHQELLLFFSALITIKISCSDNKSREMGWSVLGKYKFFCNTLWIVTEDHLFSPAAFLSFYCFPERMLI